MQKDSDVYNLVQSLPHHKNILRTIASNNKGIIVTGSFDKTCAFFYKKDEESPYVHLKDTNYHDDYVYVVRPEMNDLGFFSGSKDTKVVFMDNEGNPLGEYIGHTGTVNDISQAEPDSFVSGSWDTTARVWDINSQKCLFMLKDHSYAVSTLALWNKRYITGSQDKKLRFWDKDRLVKTVDQAHDDIIRDIVLSPDGNTFFTCGNDYMIKQWTLDGELIEQLSGHDGFIFRLAFNRFNNLLFSAGDDRVVKTWKNGKYNQDIFHPNTVWDLTINSLNGDLLTACADGTVRVFSNNPSNWLSQQDLMEYTDLCLLSNKQEEETNKHVDVSKLPKLEEINLIKSPKEGEIRVFNNNGTAEAYVYKVSQRNWEKIGEVLGTKDDKKNYPGDKVFPAGNYDFVFDVDLEGRHSKIPFNKGDNCLLTAEKFCNREELTRGLYVDDITKFLRQNTKDLTSQSMKESEQNKPKVNKQNISSCLIKFPVTNLNKYDSINVEGPLKKILEFNQNLVNSNSALALNEQQIHHFKNFLKTLGNPQFYHTSKFSQNEYDVFTKVIARWPFEYITPYLDVFRMFLLHPRSNEMFQKIGGGVQELTLIMEVLKSGADVHKILVLRILNNMFLNEASRLYIKEKRADVLDSVSSYLDTENKLLRSSVVGHLLNYSIEFYDKSDNEAFMQILSLLNEMLITEKDSKMIINLLIAVGNFLFNNPTNIEIAKDMDILANVKEVNLSETTGEDLNLIKNLKDYMTNLLN